MIETQPFLKIIMPIASSELEKKTQLVTVSKWINNNTYTCNNVHCTLFYVTITYSVHAHVHVHKTIVGTTLF